MDVSKTRIEEADGVRERRADLKLWPMVAAALVGRGLPDDAPFTQQFFNQFP